MMWNFRTGRKDIYTRKEAEALGLETPKGALAIRLEIHPVYPERHGFGCIQFGTGFLWSQPVSGNADKKEQPAG